MINSPLNEQQVISLLEQAKLSPKILAMQVCSGGGNNRTYKVINEEGAYAVKQYFRQEGDKRDRLATEFGFLSFAKLASPNRVPFAFSKHPASDLALYEFVEGVPLQAADISERELDEASEFFCELNASSMKTKASSLPLASEACFSIQDHLNLISKRLHDLQQVQPVTETDVMAKELINKLQGRWQSFCYKTNANLKDDLALEDAQRCVSPSDFGFHNALRMHDGSLRFLDFEYAGWDDPAKMVGDFFSQLAIPVPIKFFNRFTQRVMTPFPGKDKLIKRAHLLRGVYQMKWCCIALNIFIPMHLARRQFANPHLNVEELKQAQLKKAEGLMNKLELTDG